MSGPFRILLLARDSADRRAVAEMLGAGVVAVASPLDFALRFAEGVGDLAIVCDDLEWATPLELLSTLRTRFPDLPVVMWLAPGSTEATIAAFRAGCTDVVLRVPGSGLDLREVLSRCRAAPAQRADGAAPLWAMLEAAGVAAFRCRNDGRLLAGGAALARLVGLDTATPGANLLERLLPAARLDGLRRLLATGEVIDECDITAGTDDTSKLDLFAVERDGEIWGLLTGQPARGRPDPGLLEARQAAAKALAEAARLRLELRELRALRAEPTESRPVGQPEQDGGAGPDEAGLEHASPGPAESGKADCNAVMGQAKANLAAEIAETAAIITCDHLPKVPVHPAQMLQVLQNLLGNALRHRGSDAPVVHILARRVGSEWVFTVRDNGPGIPHEHRKDVFKPHWRGPGTTGAGVGLAVCRTIVTSLGGHIWVDDAEGAGAAISFSVPSESRPGFGTAPVPLKVAAES